MRFTVTDKDGAQTTDTLTVTVGHGDIFKLWIDGQQVTSTGKRALGLVTSC